MMLSAVDTFAGCMGKRKAMVVASHATEPSLLYISSSNIVVAGLHCVKDVIFMDHALNCISSTGGKVVCGDIQGFGYVMESGCEFKARCDGKIQDCCFLDGSIAVFSTLDSIVIFDYRKPETTTHKVGFMVSCISTARDCILVGSVSGGLYAYSFCALSRSVVLVEKVDAHSDSITDIKAYQDRFVATCSQDTNVKVWELGSSITLVQTLNGHSDWVNSIAWGNSVLYSASSDKTIRIWEQSKDGNAPGFYTCAGVIGGASEFLDVLVFEGRLLGHLKTGGIDKLLDPEYFISGHLGEVTDVDWKGELLLSCSLDRTARIFYKGKECGRPQNHGYPLSSSKFLPGSKLRFISSGQETILRIYEATQNFFLNCHEAEGLHSSMPEDCSGFGPLEGYSKRAYLSELNLTNEVAEHNDQEPLSENSLSTNVFKEIRKIYGHYFEIKNIAVGRSVILSCNRSAAKNFAGVFLWSLDGDRLQYVADHDLGIQRIAISMDDALALTVSRDKTSCLYSIQNARLVLLKRFADHERAVWDCGFSRDGRFAATCSRDGRVILYDTCSLGIRASREVSSEATSLGFSPADDLLAVGTDTGVVKVLNYSLETVEESRVVGKRVNTLKFNEDGKKIAVGGSDGLLRVLALSR